MLRTTTHAVACRPKRTARRVSHFHFASIVLALGLVTLPSASKAQLKCEWLNHMREKEPHAAVLYTMGMADGFVHGLDFAERVAERQWPAGEVSTVRRKLRRMVPYAYGAEFATSSICDSNPPINVEDAFMMAIDTVRRDREATGDEVAAYSKPSLVESLVRNVWFAGIVGLALGLLSASVFWRRRRNGSAS